MLRSKWEHFFVIFMEASLVWHLEYGAPIYLGYGFTHTSFI